MATYTLGQLIKSESSEVYVLNTSIGVSRHKRSSNVAFEIHYANQIRSVIVHDSWVPQNLAMQAPKEVILASPSFREAINKGLIELVRDPEAEKVLEDEDAVVELVRLKNKHNKANADLDTDPIMPKDIIVQKEAENDGISPMIKDICINEDRSAVEVYAKIRGAEKSLSKEEFQYLNRNLNGASRNEKIDALIRKHI
jgi:hypothetical protein